ncbi:uncharacterized protein LOC116127001 [Pistacia vera]|uniref:uncharacterized protein LOC116127001 n=1 Tax=Pistacia vera TaxID=55513 RepID=UPI001262C3BB|nr:uncharacterized protein LOC116127001 [Pistacia vera]
MKVPETGIRFIVVEIAWIVLIDQNENYAQGKWLVGYGYKELEDDVEYTSAQKKENEEKSQEKSQENSRALAFIQSGVNETIFLRIIIEEEAKTVWEVLQLEFEGSDKVKSAKLVTLIMEFERLRMQEPDSVKEYVDKVQKFLSQMKIPSEEYPKKQVDAIKESKDLDTLTINKLVGSLQASEQRVVGRMEGSTEGAFQAKQRKKWDANDKKEGKHKFSPCPVYKKMNHVEKDCWDVEEANVAKEERGKNMFMVTCRRRDKSDWLIDNGCMSHMTFDSTLFDNLDTTNRPLIIIGVVKNYEQKAGGP